VHRVKSVRPREERPPREENGPRLASDIAATEAEAFLQGLLDSFGATATITITVDEEGDLSAELVGDGLGRLIGPRGGVISAIEELTRTRLQHVASGGSTPRFKPRHRRLPRLTAPEPRESWSTRSSRRSAPRASRTSSMWCLPGSASWCTTGWPRRRPISGRTPRVKIPVRRVVLSPA
jgi:hypothetical protein